MTLSIAIQYDNLTKHEGPETYAELCVPASASNENHAVHSGRRSKSSCASDVCCLEYGAALDSLNQQQAGKPQHGDAAVDELRIRCELRQSAPIFATLTWLTLHISSTWSRLHHACITGWRRVMELYALIALERAHGHA